MNFIELTSLIGEPEEYADFPEFQSDVWPLLKRKANEIESVFVFRNSGSRGWPWAGPCQVVTERIARISSMAELTGAELDELEKLSFYGGHLNVLYRVSAESSLAGEFCSIYPTAHLSSDDLDQLELDPEPLAELRAFTEGRADVTAIERLCAQYPDVKFLVVGGF